MVNYCTKASRRLFDTKHHSVRRTETEHRATVHGESSARWSRSTKTTRHQQQQQQQHVVPPRYIRYLTRRPVGMFYQWHCWFVARFNSSVGIDLKELGVSCRNVWNLAPGLKFEADFHSKMSVCRHELGGSTPTPWQFQPWKTVLCT